MTPLINQLSLLIEANDSERLHALLVTLNVQQVVDVHTAAKIALACRRINDLERACLFSARAVEIAPEDPDLLIIHTGDLIKLGALDQAEALIIALPEQIRTGTRIQMQLGKILYQRRDFDAVLRSMQRILQQFPRFAPAHMEAAHILLMKGDWQKGWEEYEWRFEQPGTKHALPKFRMPQWDGSPGLDHILLIADQGYGDCFQFSRYIPMVAQRCKKITLMRSKPLALLLDSVPGITQGVANWDSTPLTDAYCTLSGLPRLFETRPHSIPPASTAQLKPSDSDLMRWQEKIDSLSTDGALRVGIVWTGRTEFESNYLRAVPPELMATLADVENVQLFSLQVGMTALHAKNMNAIDLAPGFSDFADTAAAIASLDLVITTDTSVAHLAGSLGAPTWVLLGYAADWRWGESGDTSAWYDSVRLFRQDERRRWEPVIAACKQALTEQIHQQQGQ